MSLWPAMSIAHFSCLCFGKDVWAKHYPCLINSRNCLHPLENYLLAKFDCLYIHSVCSQPCGLLRQLHNVTYSNYLISTKKKRHNIFIVPWVFSTDIMSLTPREKFASLCQFFNVWYLPEFMYFSHQNIHFNCHVYLDIVLNPGDTLVNKTWPMFSGSF